MTNINGLFNTAIKITRIALVSYVIIKQIFFFVFIDTNYWIPRIIASGVMLVLVFLITSSKKITNRQMSWMVPVCAALIEITISVLISGDQMIYIALVGCVLLSLLFVDTFGFVVTIIVSNAGAALCLFLFGFTLLGKSYPFEYDIFYFSGMLVLNLIIFLIGKYTIGTIIKSNKAAVTAQEATKKALVRVETIMNNLPGMVFQCHYDPPDWTYTFVSEGCRELTGYSPEELIGKSAVKILGITPDDSNRINLQSEQTLASNLPFEAAFQIRKKDGGSCLIWERSRTTETTPDGKPFLIDGYYSNITERQKLEESEMANRAKTAFLANMSHELRTPLNVILGLTSLLLEEDKLGQGVLEKLNKVNSAGNALSDMVNDILTFSKIESDRYQIEHDVSENFRKFRRIEDYYESNKKIVREDLSFARVLVVDDMQANLDVASGLLGKYNMTVDCVQSGKDAVEKIRRGEPVYNAVFMDYMMPEMDGIETAEAIRDLGTEYARNLPIIALTANAIQGTEEVFFSRGFQAFLTKPVSVVLLDSVVQRWIRK